MIFHFCVKRFDIMKFFDILKSAQKLLRNILSKFLYRWEAVHRILQSPFDGKHENDRKSCFETTLRHDFTVIVSEEKNDGSFVSEYLVINLTYVSYLNRIALVLVLTFGFSTIKSP